MTSGLVTYEDLAKMKKEILQASAPASIVKEVNASTKFRRLLGADMAIGRALTGPQFIDTVAIQDGAVTADKLVANLVLSTSIIAGADSPADRLVLDATGLEAFGTVSGTPNTSTLKIETDGDFRFGTGAGAITYTASTGTLVVPAATIASLTIADVGGGEIGGTYTAGGTSGSRIELSFSALRAYNAAGNRTLNISTTTGEVEISSDPVGADRLDLNAGGIELWKASNRVFYLQVGATNTVQMLLTGPGAGEYIGLNPTDGLWLGASTFAGASTKFRVSPAGVLNAASAVISGAITATSGSLQTLTVDGTLTMGASGLIRTSASTTRVELDDTGMHGYNAGTKRFQVLNDGSGWLGASTTLAWTNAGALTLAGFAANSTTLSSGSGGSYVTMSSGATAFSAGGATPSSAPFRVTSGGAVTMSSATITGTSTFSGSLSAATGTFSGSLSAATGSFSGSLSAATGSFNGALTASSLSITGTASFSGGSMTLPNGGTITQSAVNIQGNSGGANGNIDNMNVANLSVDGTITIASGGSIVDGDGSSWTQSGLILNSSGTFGDAIRWRTSGVDRGSIYTTASGMTLSGGAGGSSDGFLILTTSQVTLTTAGASGPSLVLGSSATSIYRGATIQLDINSSHYVSTASRIYPGSGSIQSTRYFYDSGSHLGFGGVTVGGSAASWSGGSPTGAAYFTHVINGVSCRIPFWADS